MTVNDFFALGPLLLLAAASVLVMLLIALKASHKIVQSLSLLFFAFAFFSLFYTDKQLSNSVAWLFVTDGFSVFIMGIIIFSGLVVNILSYIYFDEKEENPREYYVLLFLCTLGACTLAVSRHFISLFLGLEILTIGLYALVAYFKIRHDAIEAGIKYLILAAFSSAFLLFGMSLIYLDTGSMNFGEINHLISFESSLSPVFLSGFGLMLVGIGFKLAIFPFHMWTADVYQGAPAPVSALIATASKGGVLAVLLRFFINIQGVRFQMLILILVAVAIASMIIGNLLALQQKNVKRLLAYSSIAHLGYLLVALIPSTEISISAIGFYLLAYSLSILAAFGVITVLSDKDRDAEDIEQYRALFWRKPLLASIFSAALISLAGIPLTMGFMGKFYILASALQTGFWLTAIILILSSVVGLFYYLRVITTMFSPTIATETEETSRHPVYYLISSVALSVLTLMIVWLGIYPSSVLSLMQLLGFK